MLCYLWEDSLGSVVISEISFVYIRVIVDD